MGCAVTESTRRDFLRGLGLLLVSGAAGAFGEETILALGAEAKGNKSLNIAPWTGDDFTLGHRLRGGEMPRIPKNSERKVDFVIVGGGVSGLTTAFYLRNHNVLLLEQYDKLGGQSRGGTHRGIDYSYGAAYIGEPEGLMEDLVSDLALKPVLIPSKKNAFFWDNRFYEGIDGPADNKLYSQFKRLIADSKKTWELWEGKSEPTLPFSDPELKRLDATPFSSVLTGYTPAFVSLLDSFFKASACGGVQHLSALAGHIIVEDLAIPSCVFPGGNTAITKALSAKVAAANKNACHSDCFVWSIELKDSGASVVYGTKDGAMHRVDCRHVILATPPLVTWRLLTNMKDAAKASLMWFKYGSYLVANLLLSKKIFSSSFDNFFGSPFSFADMTIAETPYMLTKKYKPQMGSVLTVYQPYASGSQGRTILQGGDREKIARPIVDQVSKLMTAGALQSNLEQIVLSRWGHAMAIPVPGYYNRIGKIAAMAKDDHNYSLAHSSLQGLPSAEAAVYAARSAADRALKVRPTAKKQ